MSKNKVPKLNDAELLNLGKKLQDFYEMGYINRRQALFFSFLKGLVSGFGAFLGGSVLIGLLVWVLSFFKEVPLLSHFVNIFQHTIKK